VLRPTLCAGRAPIWARAAAALSPAVGVLHASARSCMVASASSARARARGDAMRGVDGVRALRRPRAARACRPVVRASTRGPPRAARCALLRTGTVLAGFALGAGRDALEVLLDHALVAPAARAPDGHRLESHEALRAGAHAQPRVRVCVSVVARAGAVKQRCIRERRERGFVAELEVARARQDIRVALCVLITFAIAGHGGRARRPGAALDAPAKDGLLEALA
jgi:hypothetical protein